MSAKPCSGTAEDGCLRLSSWAIWQVGALCGARVTAAIELCQAGMLVLS